MKAALTSGSLSPQSPLVASRHIPTRSSIATPISATSGSRLSAFPAAGVCLNSSMKNRQSRRWRASANARCWRSAVESRSSSAAFMCQG